HRGGAQAAGMMRLTFLLFLTAGAALAQQDFESRGFFETYNRFYPDTTPLDSGNAVSEELFRYEFTWKFGPSFQINAAFDGRFDSHQEVDRVWHLDWADRSLRRPPTSVRALNAVFSKGRFTATLGKQFVRWGKADILNPTDRFAPRDFLTLTDADFLAIPAARIIYDTGTDS